MDTQKLITIFIMYNIIINIALVVHQEGASYSYGNTIQSDDFQTGYTNSLEQHGIAAAERQQKDFDQELVPNNPQNYNPDRLNIIDIGTTVWNTLSLILPTWIWRFPQELDTEQVNQLGNNQTTNILYTITAKAVYWFGWVLVILVSMETFFILWNKKTS